MNYFASTLLGLSISCSLLVCASCVIYECLVMPAECFSPEQGEPTTVKFMTYNILKHQNEEKWESRKDVVFETIAITEPDVLAIQELMEQQKDDFEAAFPDYRKIFVSNEDREERDLWNAIYVKKENFKILDYGHFWFSETPEVPSNQWNNETLRVCLWSRIEDASDHYPVMAAVRFPTGKIRRLIAH